MREKPEEVKCLTYWVYFLVVVATVYDTGDGAHGQWEQRVHSHHLWCGMLQGGRGISESGGVEDEVQEWDVQQVRDSRVTEIYGGCRSLIVTFCNALTDWPALLHKGTSPLFLHVMRECFGR